MSFITISEKPNAVDFAKNGLRYKINVPDYIINPGSKASFYFKKIGDLAQWNAFNIPIPGSSDVVQGSAIGVSIGIPNSIRYGVTIKETIEDLKSLYLIDKYYNVYLTDTDKITFQTKAKILIDVSNISFVGSNPGYEFINPDYINSPGSDAVYRDNTYVVVKIYYRNETVCELKLNIDNDGNTELEVGKFLNTNFVNKDSVIKSFFERQDSFSFKIGFSAVLYTGSFYPYVFDELIALPGKIPFNEYPDYNFDNAVFLNTFKKIETYSEAFHKLTFFVGSSTNTPITFYGILYYTDGTNEQVEITSFQSAAYNLYQLDFFISDLSALSNHPEKEVYRINISPHLGTASVNIYIKEKSFLDKQFLFKNNFGFWEILNCKGFKKKVKKIERNIYKKHVFAAYTSDSGEYASDIINSHSEFEVETGSKETYEITQISNALRSGEFYEIVDDKYIKCELTNNDIEVFNEAEDLQNIIIKYRYSFDD